MAIRIWNNINRPHVIKWHFYMKMIWKKTEGDKKDELTLTLFLFLMLLYENHLVE